MRPGVTLVEILLVIALLVALGSLVLPVTVEASRGRAFDSAAESVRGQLLLARAHAQSTGRPVEVAYIARPPRVAARFFDGASHEIPYAWADQALPGGVRIEPDQGPDDADARVPAGDAAAAELTLAVFTPDGSALLAAAALIRDDHGREARLAVNPWTGLPASEADGQQE